MHKKREKERNKKREWRDRRLHLPRSAQAMQALRKKTKGTQPQLAAAAAMTCRKKQEADCLYSHQRASFKQIPLKR
jgi:hypothetical protein